MLYVYTGTDREKIREAMGKKIATLGRGVRVIRVTDAHTRTDLLEVLRGGGIFGEKQAVVCEDVCTNVDMYDVLASALPTLASAEQSFFLLEEKPNTELSRMFKKYADEHVAHNTKKQLDDTSIFSLANALRAHDKKALWIGYQKELLKGTAPEAVHGVLFWAAKEMFLKGGTKRAAELVALLAELPHEARRKGVELEYALERFALSGA